MAELMPYFSKSNSIQIHSIMNGLLKLKDLLRFSLRHRPSNNPWVRSQQQLPTGEELLGPQYSQDTYAQEQPWSLLNSEAIDVQLVNFNTQF
jgi:hypothetical protein